MTRNKESGFTLLEIMVVVTIIGILAALIAPRFMEQAAEAKVKATRAQMESISQALKLYRLQQNRYPTSAEGLNALVHPSRDGKRYLDRVPKDAWGNDFVYLCPGVHGDFDLLSYGADGKVGGSGDDADIGNWQ
ncbi:MAG TPA: type II secretion system major pseudopilin GspG [Mariprofundaceae bacterium]|nr:type II secretion system major pseudopilin GspG [Mariprofundaceae bacterium]